MQNVNALFGLVKPWNKRFVIFLFSAVCLHGITTCEDSTVFRSSNVLNSCADDVGSTRLKNKTLSNSSMMSAYIETSCLFDCRGSGENIL